MLQKKYVFHTFDELESIAAEITSSNAYRNASGVLLQLYNPKIDTADEEIIAYLHATCEKACLVGLTCANIADQEFDIKDEPIECKKVTAYIPDNPDLYENLTGLQYLNFVADVFGISAEDREERIKKYADMFEITDSLGDQISSYSHGMKQKVAIISALIHEPKLMVLDEPFVGLDPKASFILKEIMHEMCRNGSAIFFSTHVLDVAEKLCNKVAIIKKGRIIATGTMEEITEGHSLEEAFLGDTFAEANHE